MRTRSNSNRQNMEQLIISAARTSFENKGVARTTVTDIAREANITRELFYYYFRSKDEVKQRVLKQYSAEGQQYAKQWIESQSDGSGTFGDFVQLFRSYLFGEDGSGAVHSVLMETGEIYNVLWDTIKESAELMKGTIVFENFEKPSNASAEIAMAFVLYGTLGFLEQKETVNDEVIAETVKAAFGCNDMK